MFSFLFGRALARWLERMTEAPMPESQVGRSAPPAPVVELSDPQEATSAEPFVGGDEAALASPRVARAAMGCLFEIYLVGEDGESLAGAAEQALDEVERLDRQLSHYRDDSDIARLNAHAWEQWVRVEPRLFELLQRCAAWHAETGGAFDITAGPLVRAWGFHDGAHRVPGDKEIASLLERVGMDRLELDARDNLVRFLAPGMELNLGAVGKGYALDEAADVLRFYHAGRGVLHGGQSTILALGAPPAQPGWELTLRDPRDGSPVETLVLRDEALSTSSGFQQSFEASGRRYGHILDPRGGYPAQGVVSAWVVAPSAAESDALSTACFVLGREGAGAACGGRPGVRALLIEESGVTRIGFGEPA